VGIQRLWKVLSRHGLKSTVAMNSKVAQRYPYLVGKINERGDELIAHGVDMGKPHYGGMDDEVEASLVRESVSVLREMSGQPVTGWWSPGKSESWHTLRHLADNGIDYVCDWVNDDMPYAMNDGAGRQLTAMPHSSEIWDRTIITDNKHNEDEWVEQLKDQFSVLYDETDRYGGRVMSIVLTPYIAGMHYRIKYLDEALAWITGHDHVWSATGAEILEAFTAQK
jgi:peptidoglycan/xylan/chitin deacetylase (PgdA/CDA1 family)